MLCPGDDRLHIDPDVLRERPEIVEMLAEACDKPGFRVMVQSAYSRTEFTQ
jgi:hypothetical protein